MPESHMPEAPLPSSTMLEGKVALVSGIGPGMGRDVALLLARHGADVVLGARRTEKSEEVAAEVREIGRKAEVVQLDITDPGACEAAVARATDALAGSTSS
jgi:NAD(P)-dependent dehydrogenase (short-subunit alcohol dehydrogenase family)